MGVSEVKLKKSPSRYRVGGIEVKAYTASEARAEYKRRTGKDRVPVGVKAVKLPPTEDEAA